MKKFSLIFSIVIVTIFLFIYVISLNVIDSQNVESVFSNEYENNIDKFILENEEMLLSIYDIDISGDTLTDAQKEYITNVYIMLNRNRYNYNIITLENGKESIFVDDFSKAYYYLFSERYVSDEKYIPLCCINVEKFHIQSRNIVKYSYIDNMHVIYIEYTTAFLDKEFKYSVKYNIGCKDEKYYLIGFTITKL